jgi:hypothetical protein
VSDDQAASIVEREGVHGAWNHTSTLSPSAIAIDVRSALIARPRLSYLTIVNPRTTRRSRARTGIA